MMSGEWVFIVNQNLELALLSAESYLKLSGNRASSRSCTFQFSLDQNSKSVQKFSTSSSYDLVLKTQGKIENGLSTRKTIPFSVFAAPFLLHILLHDDAHFFKTWQMGNFVYTLYIGIPRNSHQATDRLD